MLKIYNTLGRELQEFKPQQAPMVTFYHCGPTVYWTQHLGNMRAMVLADLIRRSLVYLGYQVKFARNYTDVGHLTSDQDEGEDKMIKGAKREGLSPTELADKYIKIFEQDVAELNTWPADYKPRATEYIQPIIQAVQVLLAKGYAYTTDLAIYYDVSKFKNYTQLSGQDLTKNIAEAGKGEVGDPQKKNSTDFALWFFKAGTHQNALQTWPSPFNSPLVKDGQGFPGWHIECSVMSSKLLGQTLDIHMGGVDHIPVHHTNEIAQSEAISGQKFVNYWLHNEHLSFGGEKMAKSTGAGYALQEAKAKGFTPLAVRYLFLQAHYRSKQNFTWEALTAASNGYENLVSQVLVLRQKISWWQKLFTKISSAGLVYQQKFVAAISDDFNLPQALTVLWGLLGDKNLATAEKYKLALEFDKVLGLRLAEVKEIKVEITEEVKNLVAQRQQARQNKDWALADSLRQQIEGLGYNLKDSAQGVGITKK
ncbi:MAG: cysteine--tRNA ligase [Candidatus Buchananbacteria bacterium]